MQTIGLTIFDESQLYVASEFRKVFKRIHSRYTIGLSATPDIREDKLDVIHLSWIGPILNAESIENFSKRQDVFQSTATCIHYSAPLEHVNYEVRADGMINYQSIIETIVNDPYRNKLIINLILSYSQRLFNVFVFSDRRSHLEHIYQLLCDHLSSHNNDRSFQIELPESDLKFSILYGGSSEDQIQTANKVSNIVLTTFQYSSVGTSIEKMNCLLMATPRRTNMKQIINRIFRLGANQHIERQIIDIVDRKMPIHKQYPERLAAYKERGCSIVIKNYNPLHSNE